jgi:hypothetical protein
MKIFWFNIIFILLPMLPNLVLIALPPKNAPVDSAMSRSLIALTVLERLGQVGSFVLPVFFAVQWGGWVQAAAVIVMVLSIAVYYTGWLRFHLKGRDFRLFFSPMFGLPIPLAISPVVYFLSLSLLLAAGHLPISIHTAKENAI